jgi:hypothetical protein
VRLRNGKRDSPQKVTISHEGDFYYAYLCGIHRISGKGRTPIAAAKSLAQEVRKMILDAVEHDKRVLQGVK